MTMQNTELKIAEKNYSDSLKSVMCFIAERIPQDYPRFIELMSVMWEKENLWKEKFLDRKVIKK